MLPIHHVSFRTPTIPIRPGSLTVVVGKIAGGQLTLLQMKRALLKQTKRTAQSIMRRVL
jgi:hypothetical protein